VERDRPEHDVLPQPEGRFTDGGIAASRRRKTPLVLPYGGERRSGPGIAQPPGKRSLPRRERQIGSFFTRGHKSSSGLREGLACKERRKGPGFAAVPRNRDNWWTRRKDAKGRCFAQPPEPGPLPRRRPQVILWRETKKISLAGGCSSSSGERPRASCDAKRGLCAKRGAEKGSRPADLSAQADSGLVRSLS